MRRFLTSGRDPKLQSGDDTPDSVLPDRLPSAAPWWENPDLGALALWWLSVMGYYVAFTSPNWRFYPNLFDPRLHTDAWYALLFCGLCGVIHGKPRRTLWFFLSLAGSFVVLVLMLWALDLLKAMV